MAKGRAELAARSAITALGLLVGGCTALLGVTDVTEAVDASDGGGSLGVSGDASATDGTMPRSGDTGADSTTDRSADAALDSTRDGGEGDVGSVDGEAGQATAMPEAGDGGMTVEAGRCLTTDLLCDGGCVPNDTRHCGMCGNDCTALAHVGGAVACVSGVCSFSCASGWAHCADAGATAACETDVSTATNCGVCGYKCPTSTPLCSGSGGAFMCVSGCPAGTPTLCGGSSCVDTTSSPGHCGSCTNACTTADPHAQPACVGSACTLTCNAGYSLCTGACVDEQTDKGNCGTCGNACPAGAPVCLKGVCAACTPTATRCSGAVPQTCDASGAWQSSAVTAGQCGAVCTPGAMQCSGNPSISVQTCGPSGQWDGAVTPCAPFACGATACKSTCTTDADCSAGNFCWNSACAKVAKIAVGGFHTCALTTAGGVQCWGYNRFGQLGNNATTNSLVPVAVSGLSSGVSALSAGDLHTCAVTAGGVQCWGNNDSGQLGNNATTNSLVPVAVSGLSSGVSALSAGGSHTCALTTAGGGQCWGYNSYGQLGNSSTTDSRVPVAVSGLSSGVSAISAGGSHTCALTTAGGVQCWGNNVYGELGNNSTSSSPVPVAVSSLSSGVWAVAAGALHTCALTTAGGVQCWGYNFYGQLGNNSTTNGLVPVAVSGLSSGVSALSAGTYHTCALTTAGGIQCWGYNANGELGHNSTTNSFVPLPVFGLSSGVSAVAAGDEHTCALTTAGGVQCWGYNLYGPLGNGSTTNSLVPVQVVEP